MLWKGRETGSLQFSLDRNEVSAPYYLDTSVNLSNKSSLVGNSESILVFASKGSRCSESLLVDKLMAVV